MNPDPPTSQAMSLPSFFARVLWMAIGPFALVVAAFAIARSEGPGPGIGDAAYGAALVALLAVRVLDYALLGGKNSDGKPETPQGLKYWVATVAGVGVASWGIAHAIAWGLQ